MFLIYFVQVEMLTEQLDHLREKYRSKHDECKHIEHQMNAMERFVLLTVEIVLSDFVIRIGLASYFLFKHIK